MKNQPWQSAKRLELIGKFWLYHVVAKSGTSGLAWISTDLVNDPQSRAQVEWNPSPDAEKSVEHFAFDDLPIKLQVRLIAENLHAELFEQLYINPEALAMDYAGDLAFGEFSRETLDNLIEELHEIDGEIGRHYLVKLEAIKQHPFQKALASESDLAVTDPATDSAPHEADILDFGDASAGQDSRKSVEDPP